MSPSESLPVEGLLAVDKPVGPTSHDVVASFRRSMGTRRCGHAGTLDPDASGLLILGFGRATRLLGYLTGHDKTYVATIRLGQATSTDDAAGVTLSSIGAAGVTPDAVLAAVGQFRGQIQQRPSSVSAVHVDGQRAHKLVRDGQTVELPERTVTVSEYKVHGVRSSLVDGLEFLDVDVEVSVSTGTYVRALARDLGDVLGVGGHVLTLRRTRIGQFEVADAVMIDAVDAAEHLISLPSAVDILFPRIDVDAADAHRVRNGIRLATTEAESDQTFGVFGPDGELLALGNKRAEQLAYAVVFAAHRSAE